MRIYLFTAKILYVSKFNDFFFTNALYKFNNIVYNFFIVKAHFVAFWKGKKAKMGKLRIVIQTIIILPSRQPVKQKHKNK